MCYLDPIVLTIRFCIGHGMITHLQILQETWSVAISMRRERTLTIRVYHREGKARVYANDKDGAYWKLLFVLIYCFIICMHWFPFIEKHIYVFLYSNMFH